MMRFPSGDFMKILRLFINDNLEEKINWKLIIDNKLDTEGLDYWDDLPNNLDCKIDVFLNSKCCSIMNINISNISNIKLNDEIILNLLEENLADDIDNIKPIFLYTDEKIAYVAIFSKSFYILLLDKLNKTGNQINFIQSFVFSTDYQENYWTLYIDEQQKFLRTSKYEYYLLDDNEPIPMLLESLLKNDNEKKVICYIQDEKVYTNLVNNFKNNFVVSNQYNFNSLFWNFYNQKNIQFEIKLDKNTKLNLLRAYKFIKKFSIIIFIIWFIKVIFLEIDNVKLENKITSKLNKIVKIDNIKDNQINKIKEKITLTKHNASIYEINDAIALMYEFLNNISIITTNNILQIIYESKKMVIILDGSLNTDQFFSYQNIFLITGLSIELQNYKDYVSQNKNNNDNDSDINQNNIINAQWVIKIEELNKL
jgi:hypothetical protein